MASTAIILWNSVNQVAREIKESHPDVNMLYLLTSGLDLRGDQIIAGVKSILGPDVPIFGATTADNGKAIKTLQFHDDLVMEYRIILVGFADPRAGVRCSPRFRPVGKHKVRNHEVRWQQDHRTGRRTGLAHADG